jgi:hypothetical protein
MDMDMANPIKNGGSSNLIEIAYRFFNNRV